MFKKGLDIFENKGEEAATAEIDQLYKQNIFETVLVNDITKYERRKSCDDNMLLKENTNGSVKGRSMIYGKNSRVWKTKEDTNIPTAENESIVITVTIDAK